MLLKIRNFIRLLAGLKPWKEVAVETGTEYVLDEECPIDVLGLIGACLSFLLSITCIVYLIVMAVNLSGVILLLLGVPL